MVSRKDLGVSSKDLGVGRKELCESGKDFARLEKNSARVVDAEDAGNSKANTTSPKPIRKKASRRRISDSVGSLKPSRQFLPNKEA